MNIIFIDPIDTLFTLKMHYSKLAYDYRGDGVVKHNLKSHDDLDPVSCGLIVDLCTALDNTKIVVCDFKMRNFDEWMEKFKARLSVYCPKLLDYLIETKCSTTPDKWIKENSELYNVDNCCWITNKYNYQKSKVEKIVCNSDYDGFGGSEYFKILSDFVNHKNKCNETNEVIDKNETMTLHEKFYKKFKKHFEYLEDK